MQEDTTRAPPKGSVPVDKGVGRTASFKFGGSGGENIRAATKTVGEKEDIGVIRGRDQQWPRKITLAAIPFLEGGESR